VYFDHNNLVLSAMACLLCFGDQLFLQLFCILICSEEKKGNFIPRRPLTRRPLTRHPLTPGKPLFTSMVAVTDANIIARFQPNLPGSILSTEHKSGCEAL
jgi:hypothetical protein